LQASAGDFVIRRADGPFAYQLAVVIDDFEQGVTDVVRGADLLDNVPRQMYLQQLLGLNPLRYAHIPVATDTSGRKLSKSTGSAAVDMAAAGTELRRVLTFVGHQPPPVLGTASVKDLLHWACENWSMERVPRVLRCAMNSNP
jgi:glutamyl-Q tRNA(Asp) synthetase